MIKIGLTGNIASGKSELEHIIERKGFKVVDLDKTVHSLFEDDEEIKTKIIKEFNTLKRNEISKIVFNDFKKKKILENIIHPKLREIVQNLDYDLVFVSGALIYEAGFGDLFNKIIFLDAPYELRLKRLMKRNNLDIETAQKIMNSQSENYKNKADFIIENSTTLNDLEEKFNKIIDLI